MTIIIVISTILVLAAVAGSWLLRRGNLRGRILAEDALKHLFHCESSGLSCTLNSLAGALSQSLDSAAAVVNELTEKKLVIPRGSELVLTIEGREYAVKVIRVHRLWERHLADETMVGELEWHKEAEEKEHVLSKEEAEALAKRLGQPVYDPHGDPIPSPDGGLPREPGKSLDAFHEGDTVRIVHVEDEPAGVYGDLVHAGLYPGMEVTIRGRDDRGIILEREDKRTLLSAVTAANLRVEKTKARRRKGPRKTLASLSLGKEAVVLGISPACRGLQRRRLMDLGLVPGTAVVAEMSSATGDPTAYRIRGATIALRKEHAELVYVDEN
ncbi:MAG: FeoA domain-containing protein [Ignavibacteriales bacterium]|nr:FeoA domain-containing protein [Ignavibacteriales bacterium]